MLILNVRHVFIQTDEKYQYSSNNKLIEINNNNTVIYLFTQYNHIQQKIHMLSWTNAYNYTHYFIECLKYKRKMIEINSEFRYIGKLCF